MKRIFLTLMIFSSLFLTSCRSIGEVQRRIVVHAIGIDTADKGYEVSYQVFTGGEAQSGGPVDASESTVVTLLAQGRTLYETEESLRLQTGKEVFLGDAELIVISEEVDARDLGEFLRYFRQSDVYLGVNVVFCRGKAKEMIGAKLGQNSATAILLRGVVESAIDSGRACSSRIIEISNALDSSEALAVPVLTLEKDKPDEDMTLSDLTIGVFDSLIVCSRGDAGIIGENETMGIRLLRGDMSKTQLTLKTERGPASVRLEGMDIQRKLIFENGSPLIRIFITGKYDVMYSPEGVSEDEICDIAEKQLLWLCKKGYDAAEKSGEDLFKIKRMLRKYAPSYEGAENAGISGTAADISVRLRKY